MSNMYYIELPKYTIYIYIYITLTAFHYISLHKFEMENEAVIVSTYGLT